MLCPAGGSGVRRGGVVVRLVSANGPFRAFFVFFKLRPFIRLLVCEGRRPGQMTHDAPVAVAQCEGFSGVVRESDADP